MNRAEQSKTAWSTALEIKMDCTIIMCKLFVLTVNGELTYLMADNDRMHKVNGGQSNDNDDPYKLVR